MKLFKSVLTVLIVLFAFQATAQETGKEPTWGQKFEQLDPVLPTPNDIRTASGAPGKNYWQQQADYHIKLTLDDAKQTITGTEEITYTNNSPDQLTYLWIQLDQNMRAKDSDTGKARVSRLGANSISPLSLQKSTVAKNFDGGFKIASVKDSNGKPLHHVINKTMMRIDLPKALNTGEKTVFNIDWSYNINDRMLLGGRSGYEYFPKDKNYNYTIAQFYPRLAVYDDINGWQNKQFLGSGEFALTFGDFKVEITVPSDHIVASTGTLQNPKQVLTKVQQQRLAKAKKSYEKPVMIVTQAEAIRSEKSPKSGTKTWIYHAENVRDFAFASSRKYIWDAMAVKIDGSEMEPMAMSYYSKEGNPLWEEHSTMAVKKTLETYSKYTIPYPYPKAISVHAASIGMEYPMICFNFGRPDEDGNYSDRVKYRMIGVIIHEVGHNFFPMIINNDERQWTWMDEGLNTFVQYRTEVEQYKNFPSRRGPASKIVDYMKGDKKYISPIMTNSEQIIQFGNNAYAKPATALSILRETVMGPELFDFAFKEYARRWAFKSPAPADLFRTMEDASAVDLDWFWKGWFYTTDHVDISVENVRWMKLNAPRTKEKQKIKAEPIPSPFEKEGKSMNAINASPIAINIGDTDDRYYGEFQNKIDDEQVKNTFDGMNVYEVSLKNNGGLVMPVILEWTYKDGSKEIEKLPAEIWRKNEYQITKNFIKDKEVESVSIDPKLETADTDTENNIFPRK